jgi:hypothetical protein
VEAVASVLDLGEGLRVRGRPRLAPDIERGVVVAELVVAEDL